MSLRMEQERRRQGFSQAALARKAEMHQSSISAIEKRRLDPWPGQRRKIAASLGWPEDRADELFEDEQP